MTELWEILQFCMIAAPYVLSVLLGILAWKMERIIRGLSEVTDTLINHEERMKARGIYAIECLPVQTIYIGSTQVNFHTRWGQHIAALGRGAHSNPRLQQDWNTYGASAFRFSVIEVIEQTDLIEAREREILHYRVMHVLPAANYNVNHSRIYAVPATPEIDPAPVAVLVSPPRRRRRSLQSDASGLSGAELNALLIDMGLEAMTAEEIAAFDNPHSRENRSSLE